MAVKGYLRQEGTGRAPTYGHWRHLMASGIQWAIIIGGGWIAVILPAVTAAALTLRDLNQAEGDRDDGTHHRETGSRP